MTRKTAKACFPFVILGWTLALQDGRARERLVAQGTLVSRVVLGSNPTFTPGACENNDPVSSATDKKSWPANGLYECPNGNRGNLDATPNPLVASCKVICLNGTKACGSSFGDPTTGSDQQGPFASVSSTERINPGPPPNGCSPGNTLFFKSHTTNVYDTSALCTAGDPPTCGQECGGDAECEACECNGGDWLYDAEGVPHCESPILIDMNSNTAQYHLTSAADGVKFDLNNDGVKEQLSWTAADSSVGFLAMDKNGNGSIDSGDELFGNFTRKRNGTLARSGFDALADLEDPAHADGAITPLDSAYSKLLLWLDQNHDGLSSPSELSPLANAGITRIDTAYVTRRRRDQYGNRYRYEGSVTIIENGQVRTRRIFDVFLVRAR